MPPTPSTSHLPYCDLVMKGGITSGVVYPKLITRLAEKYRFKNVGGTSAGAIAAAACAAAEFQRHRTGSSDGFKELGGLPDFLGDSSSSPGSPPISNLRRLFQPAPTLAGHFEVLLAGLNQRNATATALAVLGALIGRHRFLAALVAGFGVLALIAVLRSLGTVGWVGSIGLAVIWLLAYAGALIFVVLRPAYRKGTLPSRPALALVLLGALLVPALVLCQTITAPGPQAVAGVALAVLAGTVVLVMSTACAIGLCVWRFADTLLAGLHRNFWGLCSGQTQDRSGSPEGLTDWLANYLNKVAGLPADERPLTLGDLWSGSRDGHAARPDGSDMPPLERRINLEIVTTAVSQLMSFSLPLRADATQFYFDADEWARLFPAPVMTWLKQAGARGDAKSTTVTSAAGKLLHRLPDNPDLPLVVMVRMSLSFPVLLSAVPLYAVDYSCKNEKARAKRVWFSDGGLSSNMPLHFFDSPLPGHPTFAVNLKSQHPDHEIRAEQPACAAGNGRVYLAGNNKGGRQRYWTPPPDETPAGMFSFLWSIIETMKSWRDEIQFPSPGYRDRIIQISLLPDEGGLNLNMPRGHIDALSEAGECAATKLIERFLADPATGMTGEGWANHQRIRFKTFIGLMAELTTHPSLQYADWDAVIEDKRSLDYTNEDQRHAKHILDTLRELGKTIEPRRKSLIDKAPKPRPALRATPRV